MYFLSIIKNSRFTLSYLRVNSLFQMSALWILQNQAHRFLWFETPERDSADHLQTAVNSGPNWRLFGLFRIWKLDWQYFSWNLTLKLSGFETFKNELSLFRIMLENINHKLNENVFTDAFRQRGSQIQLKRRWKIWILSLKVEGVSRALRRNTFHGWVSPPGHPSTCISLLPRRSEKFC